jgi:hypothetical protein
VKTSLASSSNLAGTQCELAAWSSYLRMLLSSNEFIFVD